MKRHLISFSLRLPFMLVLLLGGASFTFAGEVRVTINPDRVLRTFPEGNPAGANICWYRDRASMVTGPIEQLGIRVLRFPYGHRADNYLWDTPPWPQKPGDNIEPRVGSPKHSPGGEPQYARPDGSFVNAMDTDEFLALCEARQCLPIMVINSQSHRYEEGVSYEQIKETAVEWVRYCNVTCGKKVRYWEIGNEADLKKEAVFTPESYAKFYRDVVQAMKAVDPTIQTGIGLVGDPKWTGYLLQELGSLVDFVVVHQYVGADAPFSSYQTYRTTKKTFIPRIDRIAPVIRKSPHPQAAKLPIFVTEYSTFSPMALYNKANDNDNDTWKALATFEMTASLASKPQVRFFTFWALRGHMEQPDSLVSMVNTETGALLPQGMGVALFARHVGSAMIEAACDAETVRCFAASSTADGSLTVWLVNRDTKAIDCVVDLGTFTPKRCVRAEQFSGRNPHDRKPSFGNAAAPALTEHGLRCSIPPLSVSAFVVSDR